MKKKFSYLFLLMLCALLSTPIYAAGVDIKGCSSFLGSKIQIDVKIANTVHNIVLIIQIVVPILLVVLGMIDLVKSVIAGKEDEIKKSQMTFVKRLIAGALVFFVFVIVKMVVSFVADDRTNMLNCFNCFINGAKEDSGECK